MGYVREPIGFNSGGRTERLWAEMVTWNYFPVLGVRLPLGRDFLPRDETAADVVVISHVVWQLNFGGDPDVLGRTVRINGNPFTIIGVAPEGFRGVTLDWGLPPDIWMPITVMDQRRITWWHLQPLLHLRDARMLHAIGRLKPGVGAGLVLRQGFVLIGCGIALGLAASLEFVRFVRGFLQGVYPDGSVDLSGLSRASWLRQPAGLPGSVPTRHTPGSDGGSPQGMNQRPFLPPCPRSPMARRRNSILSICLSAVVPEPGLRGASIARKVCRAKSPTRNFVSVRVR